MTTSTTEKSTKARESRTKGKQAELAVAKYLRTTGWAHAERAQRTGFNTGTRALADPGDITGCPGLTISVKNCKETKLADWITELDAMATPGDHLGGLRLLIVKRTGVGYDRVGEWWAYLHLGDLAGLLDGHTHTPTPPARLTVGDLAPLLHHAGYGDHHP